jgi:solute carrier family 25 phosphate transporter 23/24/25/41
MAVNHQHHPRPSLKGVLSSILAANGVAGLYRGLSVALCVNVPALAISFSVYGSMKDRFLSLHSNAFANLFVNDDTLTPLAALLSGSVSGMVSSLLLYPADVIRRRLQVGQGTQSARSHVASILRKEGVKGLYRGILPELLKVAPMVSPFFL